jgi:hypothetical protein
MNTIEYFSTAVHESAHAVAADHFKIPSYPEVFTGGRSVLFPAEVSTSYAGRCHLESPVTEFQQAVISWAGPMGQAMFSTSPDWFPPFKPSEKMLRDWFSMMLNQLRRLSDGDARGIRGYKDQWRACRSAFAILRKNRARIIRLGKCLAQVQVNAEREADERKWSGVPRPSAFPASHEDFVHLVCGGPERFDEFITHRAKSHLTNGRPWDIQTAKEILGEKFDAEFFRALDFQRTLYADFKTANAWLLAAHNFQQWAAREPE